MVCKWRWPSCATGWAWNRRRMSACTHPSPAHSPPAKPLLISRCNDENGQSTARVTRPCLTGFPQQYARWAAKSASSRIECSQNRRCHSPCSFLVTCDAVRGCFSPTARENRDLIRRHRVEKSASPGERRRSGFTPTSHVSHYPRDIAGVNPGLPGAAARALRLSIKGLTVTKRQAAVELAAAPAFVWRILWGLSQI